MPARPVLLVPRDRVLKVRCTADEWEWLQAKAEKMGMRSVSDLMRYAVGLRTKPVLPRTRKVRQEITERRKAEQAAKQEMVVLPWQRR